LRGRIVAGKSVSCFAEQKPTNNPTAHFVHCCSPLVLAKLNGQLYSRRASQNLLQRKDEVRLRWIFLELSQRWNIYIDMSAEKSVKRKVLVSQASGDPTVAAVQAAGLLSVQVLAVCRTQTIRSLSASIGAKPSLGLSGIRLAVFTRNAIFGWRACL
jgi:hypothetical protein